MKRIYLLLLMLIVGVGSTWADNVTVITTEPTTAITSTTDLDAGLSSKYYILKRGGYYLYYSANGSNSTLCRRSSLSMMDSDNDTRFLWQLSGSNGSYTIKNVKSNLSFPVISANGGLYAAETAGTYNFAYDTDHWTLTQTSGETTYQIASLGWTWDSHYGAWADGLQASSSDPLSWQIYEANIQTVDADLFANTKTLQTVVSLAKSKNSTQDATALDAAMSTLASSITTDNYNAAKTAFNNFNSAATVKTISKLDGLPGTLSSSQYSFSLANKVAISNTYDVLRFTVHSTNTESNNGTNNGHAFFALSKLSLTDADGNAISLAATDFTSNADHNSLNSTVDGGSYAALVDGNTSAYFHSAWGNGPAADHYLDIKIAEPSTEYAFSFTSRNTSNVPTVIFLEGISSETTKAALKARLDEIKFFGCGNYTNQYPASYATALATAQAVYDNEDATAFDYSSALNTLNAAFVNATLNTNIVAGKYRLINGKTAFAKNIALTTKAVNGWYGTTHTPGWEVKDVDNLEQIWTLAAGSADGSFTLYNAWEGKYLTYNSTDGFGLSTDKTDADAVFTSVGSAQYKICVNSSDAMHCDDHGYYPDYWKGKGLVAYDGSADSPSAWYLQAVTAADEITLGKAKLKTVLDTKTPIGTDPGFYNVSTQQAVYDNASATIAQVRTAYDDATAATMVKMVTGKYYRVESAFEKFTSAKAIYSDGTNLKWGAKNVTDKTQMWTPTWVNTNTGLTATVKNYGNDTYADVQTTNNTAITVSTTAANWVLASKGDGKFTITSRNSDGTSTSANPFHPKDHGNGSGTGGNIITWSGDDDASVWYIREVTSAEKELADSKQALWTSTADVLPMYRIPAIAKAYNGDLIAFGDRLPGADDIGRSSVSKEIDIQYRVSDDNGETWSTVATACDGTGNTDDGYKCAFGDAAVVGDRESNQILIMSAAGSTGYGSGQTNIARTLMTYDSSTKTWSVGTPEDKTSYFYTTVFNSTVGSMFFGAGKLCQSRYIKVGEYYRIYGAFCTNSNGNRVVYSDDFGDTWNVLGGTSATPVPGGNEPKIEELPDGRVLISSRVSGGRYFNIFTYTDTNADEAEGLWGTVALSNSSTNGIANGADCNGEIMIVPVQKTSDESTCYLALQSIGTNGRQNVTIFYKELKPTLADLGSPENFAKDWDGSMQISNTTSCYSTFVLDKNNNLAVIFEENKVGYTGGLAEAGYDLEFQTIDLGTLTGGAYTYCGTVDQVAFDKTYLQAYADQYDDVLSSTQQTAFDNLVSAVTLASDNSTIDAVYTYGLLPVALTDAKFYSEDADAGKVGHITTAAKTTLVASLASATTAEAVNTAINTALSNLAMPEVGKIYTVTARFKDGNARYMYFDAANDQYAMSTAAAKAENSTYPVTAYVKCVTAADGKYEFKNDRGYYFIYRGKTGGTSGNNAYNSNKGYASTYSEDYCYFNLATVDMSSSYISAGVTSKDLYGYLTMTGKCSDKNRMFAPSKTDYDGAESPYYNDANTSAMQIEEVTGVDIYPVTVDRDDIEVTYNGTGYTGDAVPTGGFIAVSTTTTIKTTDLSSSKSDLWNTVFTITDKAISGTCTMLAPVANTYMRLKNRDHSTYMSVSSGITSGNPAILESTQDLYRNIWKLVAVDNSTDYYLQNIYSGLYMAKVPTAPTTQGKSDGTDAPVLVVASTDDAGQYTVATMSNAYLTFTCTNTSLTEKNALHGTDWNKIVRWNAGTDNTASHWIYEKLSEADIATIRSAFETTSTTSIESIRDNAKYALVGEGIGKYTKSDAVDPARNAAIALITETSGVKPITTTTGAVIDATITTANTALTNGFTINSVPNGFYRIMSQNNSLEKGNVGKYIGNSLVNGGLALSADKSISNIMYVADNKIIAYDGGMYLQKQDDAPSTDSEASWTISENSQVPGTYALYMSKTSQWYASDWNTTDHITYGQNDANAAWTFEAVDALPLTFKSAGLGYATFNSPVPVVIPSGTTAYTCIQSNNSNSITIYKVDQDALKNDEGKYTLPANTPALLYYGSVPTEDTSVDLTVTTCTKVITDNDFVGTIATQDFSENTTGVNWYSLQKTTGGTTVGFYSKSYGTGKTLGGFKAWLNSTTNARSFTIHFDGEDTPTGLVEALGLENENVEIYDLNGRKLQSYQKGINIVNGKKVIK